MLCGVLDLWISADFREHTYAILSHREKEGINKAELLLLLLHVHIRATVDIDSDALLV